MVNFAAKIFKMGKDTKKAKSKPVAKSKSKPVAKKASVKGVKKTAKPVKKASPVKAKKVVKPVKKATPAKSKKGSKVIKKAVPVKSKRISKPVKKATPVKAKKVVKPVKKAKPVAKKVVKKVEKKIVKKQVKVAAQKTAKPVVKKVAKKNVVQAKPIQKKIVKQEKPVSKVPVKQEKKKTPKPITQRAEPVTHSKEEQRELPEKINVQKMRYSDEDLKEFRELIEGKLATAREELKNLKEALDNHTDSQAGNKAWNMEEGTDSSEMEYLMNQISRQHQYIRNLELALIRVENKTYGICRVTGRLIPKERLRVVPHATMSLEAKVNRKVEETSPGAAAATPPNDFAEGFEE